MPSTGVGSGSANCAAAASVNAACAVGQDTPNASATSATLRAASPTARPIAARNRPVLRRPAGISPMASVNDPRPHAGSPQRQRTLCQRTRIGSCP